MLTEAERHSATGVERSIPSSPVAAWLRHGRTADRALRNYLVVAWLLLVLHYGRRRWFIVDDWYMLAGRDGGSFRSLVQAHNEHLMAVVVVVYRVLFNLVGLHYWPFLVAVVTTHIAVLLVVRSVLVRLGVSPWVTTLLVGLLALYGAAEEDLLWSIQIGWNAALAFGLLQVLKANRTGRLSHQDLVGICCGCLAVCSSSSIGIVLVGANAAACVLRWDVRRAVVHTLPAGALYALWYLTIGPDNPSEPGKPSLMTSLHWAARGIASPLEGITGNPMLAASLGAIVGVGAVMSTRTRGANWIKENAIPIALVAMAPALFVAISRHRWRFGAEVASSPRYTYVATVLLLPALAVAIDALWRQSRAAALAAAALIVVGVPGNIALLDDPGFGAGVYTHERQLVTALAADPRLDTAPSWIALSTGPWDLPEHTTGWLRQTRDEGRVPPPDDTPDVVANQLDLIFGLAERPGSTVGHSAHCARSARPRDFHLRQGDLLWVDDQVFIQTLDGDGEVRPGGMVYEPIRGNSMQLVVLAERLSIRSRSLDADGPNSVCRSP